MKNRIFPLFTAAIVIMCGPSRAQSILSGAVTGNEVLNHPRFQNNYFAAEHAKVDMSTGSIAQTIPLMTLTGRHLTTSVSLAYQGRGIKVNDIPSAVGLGWDLLAGGYIKREVRHLADESRIFKKIPTSADFDGLSASAQILKLFDEFYDVQVNGQALMNGWVDYAIEGNLPTLGGALPVTVDLNETVGKRVQTEVIDRLLANKYPSGVHYMSFLANFGGQFFNNAFVNVDTQPDIFHYNLNGLTGSFMFDAEGNPVSISGHDIKITPAIGPHAAAHWMITVPDGTKYIFENTDANREKTTIIADNTPVEDDWRGPTPRYDEGKTFSIFTSAWFLSRIESPTGETVSFVYEPDGKLDYSVKNPVRLDYHKSTPGFKQQPPVGKREEQFDRVDEIKITNRRRLSRISGVSGSISFSYSKVDRGITKDTYKIDKLVLADLEGNAVKTYLFNYDYFRSSTFSFLGVKTERLKLVSIDQLAGKDILQTRFVYNPLNLPSFGHSAQDYWGYYNTNAHPSLIPQVTAYVGLVGKQFAGAYRESHEARAQANILKEIYWPGGGHTAFEYALNNYYDEKMQRNINVGGLRISKVINYPDKGTANAEITEYIYTRETGGKVISTGTSMGIAKQHEIQRFNLQIGSGDGGHDSYAYYVFRSANSKYDLYLNEPVRYSMVTVVKKDATGKSLGKTVHTFTDFKTNPDENNLKYYFDYQAGKVDNIPSRMTPTPAAPRISRVTERGLPKKIIDYNDAGQVLREKENFYRFRVNAEPRKMWGYLSDSDDKLFFHGEYLFSFNVEAYYADDQRWLLEKTEEKDHLGNGVFAHTRTTEYHPVYRSFVRSVTEKLSDQAVRRIEYKYIADLSGLPYDDMKKEFIIGPVYSVEEFINGVQVAGERSKYALFPGGKFLPSSKESWGQESGYYTMISNMRYDAAGNLIEQTDRSGLTQSFVWGYGQTYKVAEVRNAAAAAVYHTSFEADGTEFANAFTGKRIFDRAVTGTYFTFTPPAGFSPAAKTTITYRYWDGSNWIPVSASYGGGSFTVPHDKIDEFRLHPANAEMQTWTFYPLIGEGSKCDVNALTTYYEYDALGRLTTVRDSERNITRYVSYLLK